MDDLHPLLILAVDMVFLILAVGGAVVHQARKNATMETSIKYLEKELEEVKTAHNTHIEEGKDTRDTIMAMARDLSALRATMEAHLGYHNQGSE